MTAQSAETGAVIEKLVRADEGTLFEQLGMRVRATEARESRVVQDNPTLVHDAPAMGPLDDLRELGRRVLRRWSRELYRVACGGEDEDGRDRESILKSLGLGDVALGGAIASILVGSFGVAPAVATVVGALIVKRLGGPAAEELCRFWGESLEEA
jgi:hypothetical protein